MVTPSYSSLISSSLSQSSSSSDSTYSLPIAVFSHVPERTQASLLSLLFSLPLEASEKWLDNPLESPLLCYSLRD